MCSSNGQRHSSNGRRSGLIQWGCGTQIAMSRTPGHPVKWATRLLCARAPQINMHLLCRYVFAAAPAATMRCSKECPTPSFGGAGERFVAADGFLFVQHQHQIDRTEHVSFRSIPNDSFLVRSVLPQARLGQRPVSELALPKRDASE